MSEWSIVRHSKCRALHRASGSNPDLSAIFYKRFSLHCAWAEPFSIAHSSDDNKLPGQSADASAPRNGGILIVSDPCVRLRVYRTAGSPAAVRLTRG